MANENQLDEQPSSGPLQIESTPDDRNLALICHIGGGFSNILIPLIVWLLKKDQSRFVDDQGKEALNFQITLLFGHIIGALTACFTFGLILMAVWITSIVFGIIGGLAAQKGEVYRYPFAIRMIK